MSDKYRQLPILPLACRPFCLEIFKRRTLKTRDPRAKGNSIGRKLQLLAATKKRHGLFCR